MNVIEEFLIQYRKQYDSYIEFARKSNAKLESELSKRGIKAIVSCRAKQPNNLRGKLKNRNEEKNYGTVQDIFNDIVDLVGIRVALYFPSDRKLVDEIVNELFDVSKSKIFPESSYKPMHTKRFSGYWATHYRVRTKKNYNANTKHQDTLFEIQVASVLMHAWAEVEHDLVYKPHSGEVSEEELAILDEINGLVLTGEIALERLQKSITRRTSESNEIGNKYELTNFIVNSLGKNYINKLKLGDTKTLSNYFKNINNLDSDTFSKYLKNVNQNVNETISDQLLNMLISDYYKDNIKDKSMRDYFSEIIGPDKDTSEFEAFIKTWIISEKTLEKLNSESGFVEKSRKYKVVKFDNLYHIGILNKDELSELKMFRNLRNNILHGIESQNDNYLNESSNRLKEITLKLISEIRTKSLKNELKSELKTILNDRR